MNRKEIFTFCFLLFNMLFAPAAGAQSTISKFRQLSRPEKWWVMTHPFVAKKALKLTRSALVVTDSMHKVGIVGHDIAGGKLDAFKHSYWMATMTQGIGARKARKLGKAHEKGNKLEFRKRKLEEGILPDSVSCAMDLWNNEQGIALGRRYKKENLHTLRKALIISIEAGEMQIIRKDDQGNYLDCSGKPIDMGLWRGKWGVPKCLVASN